MINLQSDEISIIEKKKREREKDGGVKIEKWFAVHYEEKANEI